MDFGNMSIEPEIQSNFEDFLKDCRRCRTEEERILIRKAFELAYKIHKGAFRKNGDPFILHPLEVARIVTKEIGLGMYSAVSALLHHIQFSADISFADMGAVFGAKVEQILQALSKVPEDSYNTLSLQAETFRTLLLTLSDDIRVVYIKLADRLHNMRTVNVLSAGTQQKLANETLELYAPLAHRIGLYGVKTELENLSFRVLHPDIYEELDRKLKISEKKRMHIINRFAIKVSAKLDEAGIKHEITGRTKSIYSIARKIETKNVAFEEIFDILAIRIIFEPKPDIDEALQCFEIYRMLGKIYIVQSDRLRDWVTKPKENGYEALHVTVKGPDVDWVEVQIRSQRMHEIAEKGIAAHWKYKGVQSHDSEIDNWINKMRDVLESTDKNALDKLDQFKMTLFSPEILVFTPKDDVVSLPHGATVLDFAFHIHSSLGFQCIGAQIGKKIYPLDYILQGGDRVKIITSQKASPKLNWLNFLITSKARGILKEFFKTEELKTKKEGKEIIQTAFNEMNLAPTAEIFTRFFSKFDVRNKSQLYDSVSNGIITKEQLAGELSQIVKETSQNPFLKAIARKITVTPKKTLDSVYQNGDNNEAFYIQAECCNPLPGDEIIGFPTKNNSIILHKANCRKALDLTNIYADNILNAIWTTRKIISFLTTLKISGIDHMGIVHEITGVMSVELKIDIKSIFIESRDKLFSGMIQFYTHNIVDLNNIIKRLKKVNGVKSILRMENINEL